MQQADASRQQRLPRVLVYTTALACGLFLALAVHIALTVEGVGLASVVREVTPTSTGELRSALAWWAIGMAGCLGSWGTIVLISQMTPSRPVQRVLRLSLGFVFFCLLAAAGHEASSAPVSGAAMTVAANLAAMGFGAFMAFFAAHFAARR